MKAQDVMKDRPRVCRPSDTLKKAVELMREHDCGFLPVLADGGGRVVGVLTDRDICLAAESHNEPLQDIAVKGAMHTNVHSCRPKAEIEDVLVAMRNYRVRRIPVIDSDGALVGVVSLSDLARRANADDKHDGLTRKGVAATLAAICEPRSADSYA